MSDNTENKVPTLEEIKTNLLEVRSDVNFNIGSPAAIDHLLISLVMVIDAIQAVSAPPSNIMEEKRTGE